MTTFSGAFPLGALAFRRNAAAECDSFTVSNGQVRDLLFQRVKALPAIP